MGRLSALIRAKISKLTAAPHDEPWSYTVDRAVGVEQRGEHCMPPVQTLQNPRRPGSLSKLDFRPRTVIFGPVWWVELTVGPPLN